MQLTVCSLQVGLPATHLDAAGRGWVSGIYKTPVAGPVALSTEGLTGDGQADRKHHGGPEKALLVYPSEHWPHWRPILGHDLLGAGAFGENLSTEGAIEQAVCIGDVFRCETAVVQISQPRQPCWKLARRYASRGLPLDVQVSGKTGWYLRVLEPGSLVAGQTLTLIERPHPRWPVSLANACMHTRPFDRVAGLGLAELTALSPQWRSRLLRMAQSGAGDEDLRLYGEDPSTPE
jgi:MOSC domain-containing protein YiiM